MPPASHGKESLGGIHRGHMQRRKGTRPEHHCLIHLACVLRRPAAGQISLQLTRAERDLERIFDTNGRNDCVGLRFAGPAVDGDDIRRRTVVA